MSQGEEATSKWAPAGGRDCLCSGKFRFGLAEGVFFFVGVGTATGGVPFCRDDFMMPLRHGALL